MMEGAPLWGGKGGSRHSCGGRTWSLVAHRWGRGQPDRYRSRAREGARRGHSPAPRPGHSPAPPYPPFPPKSRPESPPNLTSPSPETPNSLFFPTGAGDPDPPPWLMGVTLRPRIPPQTAGSPRPGWEERGEQVGNVQGAARNVRDPPGVTPSAHPRPFGSAGAVPAPPCCAQLPLPPPPPDLALPKLPGWKMSSPGAIWEQMVAAAGWWDHRRWLRSVPKHGCHPADPTSHPGWPQLSSAARWGGTTAQLGFGGAELEAL